MVVRGPSILPLRPIIPLSREFPRPAAKSERSIVGPGVETVVVAGLAPTLHYCSQESPAAARASIPRSPKSTGGVEGSVKMLIEPSSTIERAVSGFDRVPIPPMTRPGAVLHGH